MKDLKPEVGETREEKEGMFPANNGNWLVGRVRLQGEEIGMCRSSLGRVVKQISRTAWLLTVLSMVGLTLTACGHPSDAAMDRWS